MDIRTTLEKIIEELNSEVLTKQRRRYLESYLEDLCWYANNHPEQTDLPSSLELFCDKNPNALECRKYDV
jgi:hypothetical protein